ncbi:SPASM domain-containing protein [Klenkia sp. LSe6-5]|uniref:SPASM domain-containing protein n=1 Tax=Klenkia sesuvii TaxID=3103137 RepID=A0ABU8DZQ5_9ACTN
MADNWLLANGDGVLTGDSFLHLSAFGEALPGLDLCGAGRVVCLVDPVGDVHACPFAIHENLLAGDVRSPGGFQKVWQTSDFFTDLRSPQTGGACTTCEHFDACRGGCMAAEFFTGPVREQPTLLGMPSIPATICDESPLAGLDLRRAPAGAPCPEAMP